MTHVTSSPIESLPPQRERIRTPMTEFIRKFRKQHLAVVAALFIIALVFIAILAPWIVPFDPENYFDYDRINQAPSVLHWLGLDSSGRGIFSRLVLCTLLSLGAGVCSAP